ncbi:amidohydrolase family protein [Paenibacillus koleovorans]|uniref:amidohydrolase family protein n=1 Tax=Paenibacillus koleovorans TaxID=121608 RepID=UPI000FDA2714|nr:amidohydrolase family protein [Paenibacillus koleovorans]
MYMDVNALLGQWPFRLVRKNTLEDLRKVHQMNDISGGYVASLNSVFYNDPFEGDEELHESIGGTEYKHVLTVNPELPGWERDIEEGLRRFDIHGVRVYPSYHPFDLNGKPMANLCRVLVKHGLPLFLTKRMDDERLDYLVRQIQVPIDAVRQLIVSQPDLTIVLLTTRIAELEAIKEAIVAHPRVYFDVSGLKDRVLIIEDIIQTFPVERMLYGSNHPLFALRSSRLLVDMAHVDPEVKHKIMGENARVLERSNQPQTAK